LTAQQERCHTGSCSSSW